MDDTKVKAITDWPAPTTVCSVHSFLGLANFYRHFIKDYATLVKPLTDLTQKDKAFTWGSTEANVFASLKTRFTTAPILAYPDNDCQFRLETDTSDFATGAVLSILKDDKWHPVIFSSHVMSPEERNYLVADKEMLSVIHTLEQWHHYLEGAKHQFNIWNDHANLQWFMKWQDLTIARCDGLSTSPGSHSFGPIKQDLPWGKWMLSLVTKTMQSVLLMTTRESR